MSVTELRIDSRDGPSVETDGGDESDGASVQATEHARLDEDDLFHLLQCRRRRDALRYLRDADGPVDMRDLAEQVAAWEHDTTVRELDSDQRQRVYIPLYQTHLPKLDDVDVVDYDKHRGTIARGPNAPILDNYLGETDEEPEVDWDAYYLGTAAVSGSVLAATAALASVPRVAGAAFVVAAFTMVTLGKAVVDPDTDQSSRGS